MHPEIGPRPVDVLMHPEIGPPQRATSPFVPNDHAHAQGIADHLQNVLSAVRDPQLKESLSNALSTILKHISGIRKEHQDALAGKLSPRLLEQAYGMANSGGALNLINPQGSPLANVPQIGNGQYLPARTLAYLGHPQEAAQQWIARHPLAVGEGHIPAFVRQWEAVPQAQAAYTNAPAGTPQAL